jgi:hypothetical protein
MDGVGRASRGPARTGTALCLLLAAACGSDGTAPASHPLPASFDVLVQLTAERPEQQALLLSEHGFTLWLQSEPEPRAVAGAWGSAVSGALVALPRGWSFAGRMPVASGQPALPCQPTTHTYRYETLDLRLGDISGRPLLVGTVSGRAEHVSVDAVSAPGFTGQLSGTLDRTAPRLNLERASAAHWHPMDEVVVQASEPLPPWTEVLLQTAGASPLVLDAEPPQGERARFRTARVLGFGQRYEVATAQPLRDLADNPAEGTAAPAFETIPDPGLLSEDGFESEVSALVEAPARVVPTSELPALAGQRSLLLPPAPVFVAAGRFTARLRVDSGDRTVRLSLRGVALQPVLGRYLGRIRLGAPGHPPAVHEATWPAEPVTHIEATGLWLGPPASVTLPLPPGTTSEVVLDVAPLETCGTSGRSSGLLLDDVRVQE